MKPTLAHPARPSRLAWLTWLATLVLAAIASVFTPLNPVAAQTLQATPAATAAVRVGQPLPALALTDQHDKAWQVPAHARLVLFAAGRKASNLVQAVLENEPSDFLAQQRAAYLADMSKMPAFATRMFALPSLREMPFVVGISLTESTLANWPREADAVTLIELSGGVVTRLAYAKTPAELRAALKP
jgi:hypothetical protein